VQRFLAVAELAVEPQPVRVSLWVFGSNSGSAVRFRGLRRKITKYRTAPIDPAGLGKIRIVPSRARTELIASTALSLMVRFPF